MRKERVKAQRIPIERVARTGRAWLELKGSILLYHTESVVITASTFIPLEWVEVSHGRRRDVRQLYLGLLGTLSAVLFCLPLLGLLQFTDFRALDLVLMLALGVLLVFCLGCAVLGVARFLRQRQFTRLNILGTPTGMSIEFWREPGLRPRLDALVEKLEAAPTFVEEKLSFPIRMHHMWRRPRRHRLAVLKGFAVSFFLYLALLGLELLRMLGVAPAFSRVWYLLLLVPPLFYLGVSLLQRGFLLREPRAYRKAVRAYGRGDLDAARGHLHRLLAEDPEHDAARLLLIQACTEDYAFAEAASHCEKLAGEHPLLARRLQANIWSIERMHQRMDERPSKN